MVVRQSVARGRRAGLMTSLGVGSAILFHAAYTVAGLGLVVAHSLLAFNLLKWAGAAYLVYVASAPGVPRRRTLKAMTLAAPEPSVTGDVGSFCLGFLTNALNRRLSSSSSPSSPHWSARRHRSPFSSAMARPWRACSPAGSVSSPSASPAARPVPCSAAWAYFQPAHRRRPRSSRSAPRAPEGAPAAA